MAEAKPAIPEGAEGATPSTREAILEAARRRYLRFGPRKTTMEEVAREAGCSRATVYTHFPGKQELYSKLLEWETATFLAELETATEGPQEALEKLRCIAEATGRNFAHSTALGGAIAGDAEMSLERVAQPAVEKLEERVIELLARVLQQGVAEGTFRPVEPRLVSYLMFQLGRVLVEREREGRAEFPFERILGAMNDLVLNGITSPGPDREGTP
ncbi:MAG: TetR/AcrR family transcriptional regulator [Myxococcota bacterium]|nr:TetR/AcrR family transcriptional regulator [Myxococcota bacterium]